MIAFLDWLGHHWYWFFWLWIFGVFEGVRDFFRGIARDIGSIGDRRHRRRMEELGLLTRIAEGPAGSDRPQVTPGPCVHRNVTRVMSIDDELVGWLCKTCDTKLPPDWAVREEDL